MNVAASRLRAYSDILLDDQSSWIERKHCLEEMHELFVSLGALNVRDSDHNAAAANLGAGVAIAPTWAGMCLFDIARTRQFVAGLKQAIEHKLNLQPSQPVQVLDAGCGPYGLLSVVCAGYFSPAQVQFTLLDIFTDNIASTRKLIDALQFQTYFADVLQANALTYTWPATFPLDILVTETMNRALWKEPQVAITLQLCPQLSPGGILIPAAIEVSLQRTYRPVNTGVETAPEQNESYNGGRCEEMLGLVMRLNDQSSGEAIARRPLSTLNLPADFDAQEDRLHLISTVQVFQNVTLGSNESAITMPREIRLKPIEQSAGHRRLSFYYNMEGEPGIEWYTSQ